MFTLKTEELGDLSTIKLINSLSGEYVEVIPGYGAALNALVLRKGNSFVDVIQGCQTYEQLLNEGAKYYKGMILYPFPNRIKGGVYEFEGKKYILEINEKKLNNALHGFAAYEPFYVKKFETNGDYIHLELQYTTSGENVGWPFHSRVTVRYTLTLTGGMSCTTTVENTGNLPMPVGLGWHPYFKSLNKVDSLQLKIPAQGYLEQGADMIPTGKVIPSNPFKELKTIDTTSLDTAFPLQSSGKEHLIELHDPVKNTAVEIWLENGAGKFEYAQVYIPPDRKAIAIEPMTCCPNAFNSGQGLVVLAPGQKHAVTYGIRIR